MELKGTLRVPRTLCYRMAENQSAHTALLQPWQEADGNPKGEELQQSNTGWVNFIF